MNVGPIWDNNHAQQVAADWLAKNPGWEFRGEWRTTQEGVMSQIDVYNKVGDLTVEDYDHQPHMRKVRNGSYDVKHHHSCFKI